MYAGKYFVQGCSITDDCNNIESIFFNSLSHNLLHTLMKYSFMVHFYKFTMQLCTCMYAVENGQHIIINYTHTMSEVAMQFRKGLYIV